MLEVDRLSAGYLPGVAVVNEVSLTVGPGDVVGVVGRNGAGKSCLAGCLMGTTRHLGGRARLDGRDVSTASSVARVKAGLSLVPEGRQIFGQLSVRENLVVAAYGARRKLTPSMLEHVQKVFPLIRRKIDDHAAALSGGEQQWLAIARALVQEPKYIILDEPSLGLSPIAVESLGDSLDQLRRAGTVGLLLMEQNPYLLNRLCSQVLVMDRGTIVQTLDDMNADNEMAISKVFLS